MLVVESVREVVESDLPELEMPSALPELLVDVEVPILLRRSHVKSGYRPLNQSLSYYLQSAFIWHNEVINVWTHALPIIGLCFMYIFPELLQERPRATVMFAYFGVGCLFSCSALTHLMHSRSHLDHVFWLLVDFSGIAMFSLTVSTQRFMCRRQSSILFTSMYVPTLAGVLLLQYLSTCGLFVLRPFWKTRHMIRMVCCGAVAFWTYIPLIDRYTQNLGPDLSLQLHTRGLQWLMLAGIFMGANFPECCAPGRFDLIGYGHQFFHVCVMMVTWCVCETAHLDSPQRESGPRGLWSDPLWTPIYYVFGNAMVTMVVSMSYLMVKAKKRME